MRTHGQRGPPQEAPAAPGAAQGHARGRGRREPSRPFPGHLPFASHFLTPEAALYSFGCLNELPRPGQLQTTAMCALKFRWPEVEIEVSAGPRALWGTRGGAIPCFSQLPKAVSTPRLLDASLLAPFSHLLLLCGSPQNVSPSLSLSPCISGLRLSASQLHPAPHP